MSQIGSPMGGPTQPPTLVAQPDWDRVLSQIKLRYFLQCCLLELIYFQQCCLLKLRNSVLGVGDDVIHSDEVVDEGWG
jgi:hypothetical protein